MSDVARQVKPGDLLRVLDARRNPIEVRAVTGLERGRDFMVVRVCWPHSWALPPNERPSVPWPAEAVLEIVDEPAASYGVPVDTEEAERG